MSFGINKKQPMVWAICKRKDGTLVRKRVLFTSETAKLEAGFKRDFESKLYLKTGTINQRKASDILKHES